ncbi:preprotein translocase subunit YajC [candidate division TA06 bacterium]|uniref:Preprotein translocase subunit YajC n=1 Tax=candidate division TA06 bacterium TaxID=2250710 RepID=A0A523UTR8_UNCT6|nr:MAG: preprotein translocase subunit YajC [candidate division TA06 bacterium]
MIGTAYAMAPGGGQTGGSSGLIGLLPFILMFLVLYFLLIFPQQRKQKKHLEMMSQLKKGDRVVTSGGLHGSIVGFKDRVVIMKVDEKVKVEVEKSAITGVRRMEEDTGR